jgi:hypothetical protein
MRQQHTHARAIAQVQCNQHKITMTVAYALASAIIVLWMAYLPTLMGGILTNLKIVPTHLSSASESVNRADKNDRFAGTQFDDRWSAFAETRMRTLGENVHARVMDPAKVTRQIPVGCEPAFSYLVKAGNLSGRCLASIDIPGGLSTAADSFAARII